MKIMSWMVILACDSISEASKPQSEAPPVAAPATPHQADLVDVRAIDVAVLTWTRQQASDATTDDVAPDLPDRASVAASSGDRTVELDIGRDGTIDETWKIRDGGLERRIDAKDCRLLSMKSEPESSKWACFHPASK